LEVFTAQHTSLTTTFMPRDVAELTTGHIIVVTLYVNAGNTIRDFDLRPNRDTQPRFAV